MRLKSVEIFDFKSIKHEKIEINGSQLCFVGKNECGKSSIIQAISCLNFIDYELQNKWFNKDSDNYPKGFPIISGVFKVGFKSYLSLYELLNKHLPTIDNSKLPSKSEDSLLQIKRWGNGISNISIILSDKKSYSLNISKQAKSFAQFVDEFQNTVYPLIEYYENEELLIEAATVADLLGSEKKFEPFRRLLFLGGCHDFKLLDHHDPNFLATYHARIDRKINAILKKHYKQDENMALSIRPVTGNRLNVVLTDSSQASFSLDERSPGFRYYFSFLINKLYLKDKNEAKNLIFLLDEPGGHLHPNGSKDLLRTFDEIAKNSQILYTTHNPFLTIRNNIDSLVYVAKSPKDGTKINKKTFLNKYQVLRKELGILLNDSFLIGEINLVVEGITEKFTFHRLFQIEKYQKLEWLNIYDAGGAPNIPQAVNYLGKNNLNLSGIVILDSDEEANKIKKIKIFQNCISEQNWDVIEINDAFKDKRERTFEDLFPQDLYIGAFNQYCHSLKDLEVFEKPYIDYDYSREIPTPITNAVKNHFYSFIDETKKKDASISKQEVIRFLLDKIDMLEEKDRNESLKHCFSLLDKICTSHKNIEHYATN